MDYKSKNTLFAVFSLKTYPNTTENQTRSTGLKQAKIRIFPFPHSTVFRPRSPQFGKQLLATQWKNHYLCRPMKSQEHHIQNLIQEGEHQMLDFKFEISDSRRIARTLAAFANTDGGRLLVGVKDNGAIAGVRSDEEIHMIQAAAEMYCQPPVHYSTEEWEINGKTVLEVIIPKDKTDKHKAPDNQGDYKIFVRVRDENLVADSVLIKVWKSDKFARPAKIKFTAPETELLHYLSENKEITLQDFQQLAHISKRKAEAILADFVLVGTIQLIQTNQGSFFRLTEDSGEI